MEITEYLRMALDQLKSQIGISTVFLKTSHN